MRKDIFDPAVARIASLFEMLFEDSFKTCEAFEGLKEELRILELRLHIDVEEHHHEEVRARRPYPLSIPRSPLFCAGG